MELDEQEPLRTRVMLLGLAAAAVAGLLTYTALQLLWQLLQGVIIAEVSGEHWELPSVVGTAKLYLTFGLPLALVLSIPIGLAVWKRAESRPLRSRRAALKLGAAVGASIGALFLLLPLLMGLSIYLDESSSFDTWAYGYQTSRDGMPTLFGLALQLLDLLFLTAAGAVGGLVARWVALSRTMRG